MRATLAAFLALSCFVGLGCSITETGNPEFEGQLALALRSGRPAEVTIGPGGSEAIVDAAWVGLDPVRFVSDPLCDEIDEVETDVAVPSPVDLAAGPEVVVLEMPLADLCRVRVPMARVPAPVPMGAPPELADAAIALAGALPDGTPFLVVSRRDREADVRVSDALFAIEEGRSAVLMVFDVAVWLEGVDLASATLVDGRALVDDSNNTALLDAFEANVERALRLYRDGDEDGSLDPEDLAELLASGGP